jgi:hypothetical protein
MPRTIAALLLAVALATGLTSPATTQAKVPGASAVVADNVGYYRSPTLRNGQIVFVSEGDLWSVPLAGGQATRLTTHAGPESDPGPRAVSIIDPPGRMDPLPASTAHLGNEAANYAHAQPRSVR